MTRVIWISSPSTSSLSADPKILSNPADSTPLSPSTPPSPARLSASSASLAPAAPRTPARPQHPTALPPSPIVSLPLCLDGAAAAAATTSVKPSWARDGGAQGASLTVATVGKRQPGPRSDAKGHRSLLPPPFDRLQILRYGSRVLFPHPVTVYSFVGHGRGHPYLMALVLLLYVSFWKSGVTLEKKEEKGRF